MLRIWNSLNPDPDPAFQVNPDPVLDPGFDDQKFKKFFNYFDQKLQLLIRFPP